MLLFLGQVFWFLLPAGLANMSASMLQHLPLLGQPVDFGRSIGGRRIFGDHKTWRGIIFGITFGLLTFRFQQYLYQFDFFRELSLVDYTVQAWAFGFLLAGGAMAGDLVKSFFKRRINLVPGKSWIPFDQIDFTVGAIIAVSFVYFPGWQVSLVSIILYFFIHIIVNLIGYTIKLKRNKL